MPHLPARCFGEFVVRLGADNVLRAKHSSLLPQYDDLSFFPAVDLLAPIDQYRGLEYHSFGGVAPLLPELQIGIYPHSKENMIATHLVHDVLSGTAYITTDYVGSCYPAFSLESFYFGCSLNTAALNGLLPTPCVVTIKGYLKGVQVAVQEFNYDPFEHGVSGSHAITKANPKLGQCKHSFSRVDKVEFTTDNDLLNALLVDDIQYKLQTC